MVNGIVSLISPSVFSLLVYRKTNNFCIVIFNRATLLDSFINSEDFLAMSLGLYM